MKRFLISLLLACGFVCGPTSHVCRAGQTNEAQIIAILQSASSSVREKADACAQLKRLGTKRSVDALAALLPDPQLSHSARYALETLPTPKAGEALRQALDHTSGLLKVGIINSLAGRHELSAVPDLAKLLSSPDQAVAVASADALGRIGGSLALKRLQASASTSNGPLHQAETDAILMCAHSLLVSGHESKALKIFAALYAGEKSKQVREAAFVGMVQASGKNAVALVTDAIANGDPASQAVALHLASQLPGVEATRALAALAVGAKVPLQLALIECLVQRDDPAASPTIAALAGGADASVRVAAISALGSLGDDSAVRLLVEKAVSAVGAERTAARQSLLELNRGPVTAGMIELLKPASPELESELIRALGGRGDQSATPKLVELARVGNESERAASLQALGQLAGASQIPALVQLVVDADGDGPRSEAVDALDAVYQRMPAAGANLSMDALVKAVTGGSIETRLALLPICGELAQKSVRTALRAAVADTDPRIRDAAIHALCETKDPELLPDLLDLAGGKAGDTVRHLAVRGCVRLTTQEEGVKFSNSAKLGALSQIIAGPLNAGEKRLVLSGLAGIADRQALELAAGMLDDTAVQIEASQAVIHIAGAIRKTHPVAARAALKKVFDLSSDSDTRKSARAILDKIH